MVNICEEFGSLDGFYVHFYDYQIKPWINHILEDLEKVYRYTSPHRELFKSSKLQAANTLELQTLNKKLHFFRD